MFASRVASYNDDDLIGTDGHDGHAEATGAGTRSTAPSPALAELREAHPALADGAQLHRYASNGAGVYAFSRIEADEDREYVVAVNNATTAKTVSFATLVERRRLPAGLAGAAARPCAPTTRPGSPSPCRRCPRSSTGPLAPAARARGRPGGALRQPERGRGGRAGGGARRGGRVGPRRRVQPGHLRLAAGRWRLVDPLGTDDNAPYRVFHDLGDLPRHTHAGVPRRAARQQRQPVGDLHLGDRRGPGRRRARADAGGPVTQPTNVSMPGCHNSEIGCPERLAARVRPGADDARRRTAWCGRSRSRCPPAPTSTRPRSTSRGTRTTARARRSTGPTSRWASPRARDVTFYYDHASHWVTTDAEGPIVTAPGSFQSELGCSADWQPDCMRSLAQGPRRRRHLHSHRVRSRPAATRPRWPTA